MPGCVRIVKEAPAGWLVFDPRERRDAISHERRQAIPAPATALDDDREGVRVFRAQRRPVFRGR